MIKLKDVEVGQWFRFKFDDKYDSDWFYCRGKDNTILGHKGDVWNIGSLMENDVVLYNILFGSW